LLYLIWEINSEGIFNISVNISVDKLKTYAKIVKIVKKNSIQKYCLTLRIFIDLGNYFALTVCCFCYCLGKILGKKTIINLADIRNDMFKVKIVNFTIY